MFQRTVPSMEQLDGFRNRRVMVDAVAGYGIVVLEINVESLAAPASERVPRFRKR
jgi:hypothetical protein